MPELEFEVVSNRIEDEMWVFNEEGDLVDIGPVAIGEVRIVSGDPDTIYYECIAGLRNVGEPAIREHYLRMALTGAKRRATRAQPVPR